LPRQWQQDAGDEAQQDDRREIFKLTRERSDLRDKGYARARELLIAHEKAVNCIASHLIIHPNNPLLCNQLILSDKC
jgi:hypothetical protein